MYPNPLILAHSGIYIKEDPFYSSQVEVFELRPDLYVSWAAITIKDDICFEDLHLRGNWAINGDSMLMFLTDEESQGMTRASYVWLNDHWVAENDPSVYLRKRSRLDDIQGPFYFDHR
ncbi:hypothetical protein ADIARSV_0037 [Arcticibacter svalbardensis MN12-7]|uniref:Uncharacterized protein n=1 Tax=Arcticibacter svalbardensis MN12-7 TaxID=1150600 RepID=R9H6I2_9SPHI|nr:hypothetical protein [Arcticibacter svalbardensis]EOR96774.1 hypothetical protein ADIARSV_0037 [Arcticibacter svalbardensis MN12-7]